MSKLNFLVRNRSIQNGSQNGNNPLKCDRLIENAESRENARSVNMSEGKVDLTFERGPPRLFYYYYPCSQRGDFARSAARDQTS